MINIKLADLVNAEAALKSFVKAEMPISEGYKLGLFIEKSQVHFDLFNRSREELLQRYGKKTEDGLQYMIEGEENVKQFNDELALLCANDIQIDVPKLKLSDFASIKLEAAQVVSLKWLFEE